MNKMNKLINKLYGMQTFGLANELNCRIRLGGSRLHVVTTSMFVLMPSHPHAEGVQTFALTCKLGH